MRTVRAFKNYSVRKEDNRGIIEGIPIVFNTPTDIGGMFEETISPDAIDEKLFKDVAFFFNHDLNSKPLARTRTKSMILSKKPDGVHMESSVNLERSDAKDLYLAIADKDIDGMSWAFTVGQDEWDWANPDYPKRTITNVDHIFEVSAVNYPAYQTTTINARDSESLDSDSQALESARAEHEKALESAKELQKLNEEKAKVKEMLK